MTRYEAYLENSLEYLKEYLKAMESRPIFFVGSGFSQRYINAPTWKNLLKQLIEENPDIEMPLEYFIQEYDGDYAKIATGLVEYYRSYSWKNRTEDNNLPAFLYESTSKNIHLKFKIATILKNLMDKFEIDTHPLKEELNLLSKLNPQAIITTNYDNLLDTLFPKYESIVGQQAIRKKESTNIAHILKIHGSIEYCESIVIEQQDYKEFQEKQIYLIAKLFTYFMEHPIIFIGYSLNDENIKSILYSVKQMVDSDIEPVIENMWFIDWSRESIDSNEAPPSEKNISVGKGESVRINYIKVHTYEKLFEALYQDSIDIEMLKKIEETVYNVIKSDTITDLNVDMVSLKNLTNREEFLNSFTLSSIESGKEESLVTFSHISDPNQLASQFVLTATQLSGKVFGIDNYHWSHAYRLIEKVFEQTEIDLRGSNNKYHVKMNGITRYSMEMVNLLKRVKGGISYKIELDNKEIYYPEPTEEK